MQTHANRDTDVVMSESDSLDEIIDKYAGDGDEGQQTGELENED